MTRKEKMVFKRQVHALIQEAYRNIDMFCRNADDMVQFHTFKDKIFNETAKKIADLADRSEA